MNAVAEQLEMLGDQAVSVSVELQDEIVRGIRDRQHALVKCYEVSNLKPKQLYDPLEIDQGQFSRVMSGRAYLDPNLKFQFMRVCRNDIPLRYDALQMGYELRPIKTDSEARIAALEADNAEKDRLIKALGEMLRGK